jgi:CheY-like chemotaxis protein
MPESDGFELVERIESTPGWAGATIMMLASGGLPEDAARARTLGVAAYLIKPIRQADLLAALLATLGIDAAPTPPPDAPDESAVCAPAPPPDWPRRLHILLAEDNVVNQRLARRILEKRGHTVVLAGTGAAALAALERERFDLVLMDVQMPEMDGLEATAEIRRREQAAATDGRPAHLPIIAMTAHAMKGDDERCLQAGMDAYIAKPIQATKLAETIEAVMPEAHRPPDPDTTETLDQHTHRAF